MTYYLINGCNLTVLPSIEAVSDVYTSLKAANVPGDIYRQEDGDWEKYDAESDTFAGDFSTTEHVNSLFGFTARRALREMVEEHPLYKAAIEHIEDLEGKLDDADKELSSAIRHFEQVDLDYREFDPSDHD